MSDARPFGPYHLPMRVRFSPDTRGGEDFLPWAMSVSKTPIFSGKGGKMTWTPPPGWRPPPKRDWLVEIGEWWKRDIREMEWQELVRFETKEEAIAYVVRIRGDEGRQEAEDKRMAETIFATKGIMR